MLNFRIAGDSWIRLESPRSDWTFILGNGNGSCSCGAFCIALPLSKEPELETPAVYRLDRSLPGSLPGIVYDGFELIQRMKPIVGGKQ